MLTGLINKSLYIGQPAHEYQTVTKKVLLTDSAKLTPALFHAYMYCIYHSYTHPHDPPTEATYEHLLWNSPQAQYIWNLTKSIISQMGSTFDILSPYQIPLVFLPNAKETPSLLTSTIQHIIVASLWVI